MLAGVRHTGWPSIKYVYIAVLICIPRQPFFVCHQKGHSLIRHSASAGLDWILFTINNKCRACMLYVTATHDWNNECIVRLLPNQMRLNRQFACQTGIFLFDSPWIQYNTRDQSFCMDLAKNHNYKLLVNKDLQSALILLSSSYVTICW